MRSAARLISILVPVMAAAIVPAAAAAAAKSAADLRVQHDLQRLVAARGGPPGAIATLHRHGRTTVVWAGRANRHSRRPPRASDHMRLASVAKAFSGAVALRLVRDRRLSLDDTVARYRPDLPAAWGAVTVRQLLNHTSGVPDYTQSDGFKAQFQKAPRGFVSPGRIISWVAGDPLQFAPGSRYEYSNTDNIIVGLIAQKITGRSYRNLLRSYVFSPLRLRNTSFPSAVRLPRPFIHGYLVDPGERPQDVSEFLSPSGAWASGAVVSTPHDFGAFIRGYVSGRLFGAAARRQQFRFVPGGQSSPPGPGTNSAGLALFRYKTRCGTVYGHTGNFPGYVQFGAASKDGKRSVTTSLNIPAPTGRLLARLRATQVDAVCAALRQ